MDSALYTALLMDMGKRPDIGWTQYKEEEEEAAENRMPVYIDLPGLFYELLLLLLIPYTIDEIRWNNRVYSRLHYSLSTQYTRIVV